MALGQRLALHTSRAGRRRARSVRVLEALIADAADNARATPPSPDQAEYLSQFDSWRSRRNYPQLNIFSATNKEAQ